MMSMSARTLVSVTITDVSDKPIVYKACGMCYSKLEEFSRCQKCQKPVSVGDVTYRYTLSITASDSSMSAAIHVFGSSLNKFLGATPKQMNTLLEKCHPAFTDVSWVKTLRTCLIGQKVIVGLKTNKSSMNPNITLKKIITNLVNKDENLIAVQIFPIKTISETFYDSLERLLNPVMLSSPVQSPRNELTYWSRPSFLLPGRSSLLPCSAGRDSMLIISSGESTNDVTRSYGVEYLTWNDSQHQNQISDDRRASTKELNGINSKYKFDLKSSNSASDIFNKSSIKDDKRRSSRVKCSVSSIAVDSVSLNTDNLLKGRKSSVYQSPMRNLMSCSSQLSDRSRLSDSSMSEDELDNRLLALTVDAEREYSHGVKLPNRSAGTTCIAGTKPARDEISSRQSFAEMKFMKIGQKKNKEINWEYDSLQKIKTGTDLSDVPDVEHCQTHTGSHSVRGDPETEEFNLSGISFSSWDADSSMNDADNDDNFTEAGNRDVLDNPPDSEDMWEMIDRCGSGTDVTNPPSQISSHCKVSSHKVDSTVSRNSFDLNISNPVKNIVMCDKIIQKSKTAILRTSVIPELVNGVKRMSIEPNSAFQRAEGESDFGNNNLRGFPSCDLSKVQDSQKSQSYDHSEELFDYSEDLFDSTSGTQESHDLKSLRVPRVSDNYDGYQYMEGSEELFSQSLFDDQCQPDESVLNTSTPITQVSSVRKCKSRVYSSLRKSALSNCRDSRLQEYCSDTSFNTSADLFE